MDDHPHPYRRNLHRPYIPWSGKRLTLLVFVVVVFVWHLIGSGGNFILSLSIAVSYGMIAFAIYRMFIKRTVYRSPSEAERALRQAHVRDAAILNAQRVERARHFHPNGMPKNP